MSPFRRSEQRSCAYGSTLALDSILPRKCKVRDQNRTTAIHDRKQLQPANVIVGDAYREQGIRATATINSPGSDLRSSNAGTGSGRPINR